MDNAIAFVVRFIFLESVLKIRFLHAYPTCRMREERWRIEDLLERLEAAELLIAFATVCRKVYSRYTAQVFNYGLTDPTGPAFQDDYQATIISGVLPPSPTICLCQLRTSVESCR